MFNGFAHLEANFTLCPNQFFDEIVGKHPSCVVEVVALLIRATLGWKDPLTGDRRVEAVTPLTYFMSRGMSENSARRGLEQAIKAGFVVKTASSDPRNPARYALRWANEDMQRLAIERARRANNDSLPLESAAVNACEGQVDKNRGAKLRPPKLRPPKLAPHINKVLDSKEESILKEKTLLNVVGEKETISGNGACAETLNTNNSFESIRKKATEEITLLTGDQRSLRRYSQLFGICAEKGCLEQWDTAVSATRRRMAKTDEPLDKPGAYFCKVLSDILGERGVYVPVGSKAERDTVQLEIAASLGLEQ